MPNTKSKHSPIPAAVPTRPTNEIKLEPFQRYLIDLFSDLLLRGGTRDDVERMLFTLWSVHMRRKYDGHSQCDETIKQLWRDSRRSEWLDKFKLARLHALPRLEMRKQFGDSVSGQIRGNIRTNVAGYLQEFLDNANFEEIQFIWHVLSTWGGLALNEGEAGEIPIASAFQSEVEGGRNITLFNVPSWMEGSVLQHMEWMSRQRAELASDDDFPEAA